MLQLPDYCSSITLSQVGLGIGLTAAAYGLGNFHFRSLFSYFFLQPTHNDGGWTLNFAPEEIGWADRVFLVVFGVVNKAVRTVFGAGVKVKGGEETVRLPRLEIRCPVTVGVEHRELYDQALLVDQNGKRGEEKVNVGEGFLLASLTNQLMLLLVVHPKLPVSPLGAVNVRNRVELHDSYQPGQLLTAHASVGGTAAENQGRVTKRGIEFDIHINVTSSSSSNNLILRQIITILASCKSPARRINTDTKTAEDQEERQFERIGEIVFPISAPWRWCSVCGDYNPIHVSSLLARLFGFRGKIAHGNHVVANLLHLLPPSNAIAPAGAEAGGEGQGWWVEMQFRRPMVLPLRLIAEVTPVQKGKQEWRCVGAKDSKSYVTGSIGSL